MCICMRAYTLYTYITMSACALFSPNPSCRVPALFPGKKNLPFIQRSHVSRIRLYAPSSPVIPPESLLSGPLSRRARVSISMCSGIDLPREHVLQWAGAHRDTDHPFLSIFRWSMLYLEASARNLLVRVHQRAGIASLNHASRVIIRHRRIPRRVLNLSPRSRRRELSLGIRSLLINWRMSLAD